jgi:hypothetical protein
MQTVGRHQVLMWLGLALAFSGSPANGLARTRPTSENPDQTLTITIRVFNYTRLSEKTVAEAGTQASRIFRRAGIKVLWLSCYSSKKGLERHPACERALGPTDISLRILYRPKAPTSSFRRTVGYCLVPEPGEFGKLASVIYDRIKGMAVDAGVPQAVVLGHAAAHEIGHLLLGADRHSPRGIMRAEWRLEDLRLAARAYLRFTRQERQLLRAAVRKRWGLQETIAASKQLFEFQK